MSPKGPSLSYYVSNKLFVGGSTMGLGIVLLAMLVAAVVAALLLLAGVSIGICAVAYVATGALFIGIVHLLPYLKDDNEKP